MISTKYKNTLFRTEWNWEALLQGNRLPKIHKIPNETDEATLRQYYRDSLRQISEIKEYLDEISPDTRDEALGEIGRYFRLKECALTKDVENQLADEYMFCRATAISCYETMYEYMKDLAILIETKEGRPPLLPDFKDYEYDAYYLPKPTTATQTEAPNTDATGIERPTVKQSSIAKAVYHFSFTGKPKSKVIADWIFTHCDVKLNDGTPATSRSLAKEITTVKTDDTRRGQKFKLTLELALLATFPPLE